MGRLTTHVLDTGLGRPAQGLQIELWQMGEDPVLLKSTVTNTDGRVEGALLEGEALQGGIYELRFFAGAYLRTTQKSLAEPLFLDVIPVRFGVADASQHYHVPLLLSAFGYATYRGS